MAVFLSFDTIKVMALEDIRQIKIEKVERLRKSGVDPYPSISTRTSSIVDAIKNFDILAESREEITLSGRIMARRQHGGSVFFDIDDGSGRRIQGFIKKDIVGDSEFETFIDLIDIGDFIDITGFLFKTKKEEKTIQANSYRLLAKALLPLPEKWHGLQDVEEKLRKRYLDLMLSDEVKGKFLIRAKIIDQLRSFMQQNNFIEVDTPILQLVAGGAMAKPFGTHLNALDIEVYLRIAPELHLKRLLVGSFERVFEFSRNFRNEGMDRDHNPEFSELEFYAAYKDYQWLMTFTEEMMHALVKNIFNKLTVTYNDKEIDFTPPYKRVSFNNLLKEYADIDYDSASESDLAKKAESLKIEINKAMTKGIIADEIYKKVARSNIIQPTFIIDHPIEISPLAKKIASDPNHVERMQCIVGGHEIINSYSELNDPTDQRKRFQAQQETVKKGNEEAHPLDDDFVEALEYGMPPAAGWGLGIDRFVAILTDSHSIREVILFPLMRPK